MQDFVLAVQELGQPAPICWSYQELLKQPGPNRFAVDWLRLDSPGENADVTDTLIALGGGPPGVRLRFGEIAYLREYHRGFCTVLERVQASGVRCWNDPAEIATMFDKWASHQRFLSHGLPRPTAEIAPATYAELRPRLRQGSGRLFLKPLHGSSASGVCALRWTCGKVQMIAPLRLVNGVLYNSLRVQRYQTWDEVEAILTLLLPQGMIAEHWVSKLAIEGGVVDLRVLVIGGQARHHVARQSQHPMTNLHLGNRRGDLGALKQALGQQRWAGALALAEQAAACFPNCLYAGVDLLLDSSGKALVGEINAFGDLLPGLLDQGDSPYTALTKAWHASCPV